MTRVKAEEIRIFLCYAREDIVAVKAVYQKLSDAGYYPWMDKKDLLPGQKWRIETPKALKAARFVIIFFSKQSVSKEGYVQREFKLALDTLEEKPEGKVYIIPVRLDDCQVPESFGHIHYCDLFEKDGLELVLKTIKSQLEEPAQPEDVGIPLEEHQRVLKELEEQKKQFEKERKKLEAEKRQAEAEKRRQEQEELERQAAEEKRRRKQEIAYQQKTHQPRVIPQETPDGKIHGSKKIFLGIALVAVIVISSVIIINSIPSDSDPQADVAVNEPPPTITRDTLPKVQTEEKIPPPQLSLYTRDGRSKVILEKNKSGEWEGTLQMRLVSSTNKDSALYDNNRFYARINNYQIELQASARKYYLEGKLNFGNRRFTERPIQFFDRKNEYAASDTYSLAFDYKETPKPVKPEVYGDLFSLNKFEKISAGSFQMGSENGSSNEKPLHTVRITNPFYLGKHEVTQEQWEAVMGNNPGHFKGKNLPVESVSWEDVQEFLRRLNQQIGREIFRLPTEAEWEYACRAGTSGDYAGNLDDMAWYSSNSNAQTHPVGTKQPNDWGLYDMHGNVWEWCQDWYGYYSSGPATGSERVIRGGGWNLFALYCRSAFRGSFSPGDRSGRLGFRLVRTAP
jgi:hypothetical protein